MFLLSSQWFACGIGAGPGFLLSDDDSARQPFLATAAAVAGMFCSVIGWLGVLVGMRFIHTSLKQGVTRAGADSDPHQVAPIPTR